MKNLRIILAVFLSVIVFSGLRADEGMWIPMLLEKYNIEDMQSKGFKLSAEDIYSINQASMKDAVIMFGKICTGEIVSDQGLFFTNHHCGYSSIQSLSSVENDYLKNGFWAMSKDEELPVPGLTVTFLVRMEDVTQRVLSGTEDKATESTREEVISQNIQKIEEEAVAGTDFRAEIKPFYYGAEFYMFVYEEYKDIRLVGAPPGSIGNFGRDTDNWVWPRHTGDFSVFRIYADENNDPAEYSPDNVPFKPRKFFPVSIKPIKEGDFTMVLGYPGSTEEYLTVDAVKILNDIKYPSTIKLRTTRLNIMEKYMKTSDKTRIQYASKFRRVSNAWKKYKGVIHGLDKANTIKTKIGEEQRFTDWVNENNDRKKEYGSVLPELKDLYAEQEKFALVDNYLGENILAIEIISFTAEINRMFLSNQFSGEDEKRRAIKSFKGRVGDFFEDYDQRIDREVFVALMKYYYEDVDSEFHPAIFKKLKKKYKGNYEKFVDKILSKSKLTSKEEVLDLLDNYPENESKIYKKFSKDPVFEVFMSFVRIYREKVFSRNAFLNNEINNLYRLYVKGLREMRKDSLFYPDANFTMRVAYGSVSSSFPADAVKYEFATDMSGLFEKEATGIYDYKLPDGLDELYEKENFGSYANTNGTMPVCFIATNHTSGGNSGSPVINAEGQLIGLNFDRNWEGTMSDIDYDITQCRNIAVDIRYVLFIIDKYAGAGYLLEEMRIVE